MGFRLPMLPSLPSILTSASPRETESPWPGWWVDNLRWSIDESFRAVLDEEANAAPRFAFLGLDLHRVISTEDGDLATLTLQPYLKRVDGLTAAVRQEHRSEALRAGCTDFLEKPLDLKTLQRALASAMGAAA